MLPDDLSHVTPTRDCRSITFENPTGARGAGGSSFGGRKGAPMRVVDPGERIVLADVAGPGVVRHIWMTVPPMAPEFMRSAALEVFYDGAVEPSVSVPIVDFFGVPFGRPVHLCNALTAISEGRGFNSYIPMPWTEQIRVEFLNGAERPVPLYFQIDYTLEAEPDPDAGMLHVAFRRENPTVLTEDFTVLEGLAGPGRFLGSVVGVRVLDGGVWYGEGEVKMFIDDDGDLPTICGTGLEDYVGSAWGMGAHQTLYAGVPLVVRRSRSGRPNPDLVGFYRWHVLDPVMFADRLTVTIQQIGYEVFVEGQSEALARTQAAGSGWTHPDAPGVIATGIAERVDDYCAAAFVYCRTAQGVPRLDVARAVADIERRDYEAPSRLEVMFDSFG